MLPITWMKTKLAWAGKSKGEMKESMNTAIGTEELRAFDPDGITFMLSKQCFLNGKCGNCVPHLMFHVAQKDAKTRSADLPGSPLVLSSHFNGPPEPVTEFIDAVSECSDGTPVDADHP